MACSINCEQYDEPVCVYCEHGYIVLETDNGGTKCQSVSNENNKPENGSNFIFGKNLIIIFLVYLIWF